MENPSRGNIILNESDKKENERQTAKLPMNNSIRSHFWQDGVCCCPERMLFS